MLHGDQMKHQYLHVLQGISDVLLSTHPSLYMASLRLGLGLMGFLLHNPIQTLNSSFSMLYQLYEVCQSFLSIFRKP